MMKRHSTSCANNQGFSLLEVTIALSISGVLLAGLWQLSATVGQQRDVVAVSGQALAVGQAAQNYINFNRSALLNLSGLSTLNSVVRIKITTSDTGATLDSLQSASFLPSGFVNSNSYGQSYALYVRREDGGTIGAADPRDKLVGLLLTTGGSEISDAAGTRIVAAMGAAAVFMYASSTPATPAAATTATGNNGTWVLNFADTGWSGIGTVAQAGHIAVMVNLIPSAGLGSGGGAASLDELTDAATNYTTDYNMYVGQNAGSGTTSTYNTALGYNALMNNTAVGTAGNVAIGYNALRGGTSGTVNGVQNVAMGAYALENYYAASYNTAVGVGADRNNLSFNRRTSIGYMAGSSCTGDNTVFIGSRAGACLSGAALATNSVLVGSNVGRNSAGQENALVGTNIGSTNYVTGNYNAAMGYEALRDITATGNYNVALGYRAGANITTGTYNIMLGAETNAPTPTSNYQLNIGNFVYGDLSTDQIRLGGTSYQTDVFFDAGSRTDSVRFTVGTSSQRPTCTAALYGAMRYNTDTSSYEYCNNTGWVAPVLASAEATPPTPPASNGYFVLSSTTTDGNLGGMEGAATFCVNDLTANDWMGKADAVSRGLLNTSNVRPFLTSTEANGNLMPVTTYYFARSGKPAVGGGSFKTNYAGMGPGWADPWSAYNYFAGNLYYWIGSRDYSTNYFGLNGCCTSYCNNWRTNSSGVSTGTGQSGAGGYQRYTGYASCDQQLYLICVVNP